MTLFWTGSAKPDSLLGVGAFSQTLGTAHVGIEVKIKSPFSAQGIESSTNDLKNLTMLAFHFFKSRFWTIDILPELTLI